MSEVQERLWRPPPGGPTPGWGRPPTGTWPPFPPGPPGPGLSGLFRLEQCWQDVAQAKVVLKKMIADIIQEDPTFIQGVGVAGVTDGSDAQPGQVGELVFFNKEMNLPAGAATQIVSLGVLSPGDWDCWGEFMPGIGLTALQIILNPLPAGFTGDLNTFQVTVQEQMVMVTSTVRALTSVPSLIAMTVNTTNPAAAGVGGSWLRFMARRRR